MTKIWTDNKLEKLKICLECGLTNSEIGKKFKKTPKQIEKAIYNYGLKSYRKEKPTKKSKVLETLTNFSDAEFKELKEKLATTWNIPKTKIKASKEKPFKTFFMFCFHITFS